MARLIQVQREGAFGNYYAYFDAPIDDMTVDTFQDVVETWCLERWESCCIAWEDHFFGREKKTPLSETAKLYRIVAVNTQSSKSIFYFCT